MVNTAPSPCGTAAEASRLYRVLLINLATGYGGAETRVLNQALILQGVVAHCAVAVVYGSPLHERLLSAGVPCETISVSRIDPRLVLRLCRVIRRGGYQVVDAHNIQSIFWGHLAAWLTGASGRITTVHSDYWREYAGLRKFGYSLVFWIMRAITQQYVNVTDQLQSSAELCGHGVRSTLIYNGVCVPNNPLSEKNPRLLSEWRLEPSDYVIAVIGRLYPVKGQVHLIEAMSNLQDFPHIKLLVVGDGPTRLQLQERVEVLGIQDQVRFTGFRDDIAALLASVDCVCLPSLWELMPYVALEAAAHARPIIATSVGGVPRLLQHGRTALLVPPRNSIAIGAAIRWLVQHPDESDRIARAGYDMVKTSFSETEMLEKTIGVYARALRHR